MIEITTGTLEEFIIRHLQRHYPVTFSDLLGLLHCPPNTLKRTLLKLQHRGIVRVDPLPGTVYVRLLRSDIYYLNLHKPRKAPRPAVAVKSPSDYDGFMYL